MVIAIGLFDRRPVIEVRKHEFISPPPVFAGEEVMVQWKIVELRSGCEGVVYPIWIDSAGNRHQSKRAYVPIHEDRGDEIQVFTAPRMVPAAMVPGLATYTVTVKRWCNPLQWLWPMKDKLPEVTFTVVPRP
jgi:hypothetical protein